jgi:hypothetical protein
MPNWHPNSKEESWETATVQRPTSYLEHWIFGREKKRKDGGGK